jgi:hypothetical protein
LLKWGHVREAGFFAMRIFPQKTGFNLPPIRRKCKLFPVGAVRCLWACALAGGLSASSAQAQTMRLGPMDIFLSGSLELVYSSNVDKTYPEEENPLLDSADFYLMPGLKFNTQEVPFFRNSTFSLAGNISYQDYVERDDLDTELYSLLINFNTVLPRMTLGGSAGTAYSVDSSEDEYVPGGASRDPKLTHNAFLSGSWAMRKLRLEANGGYTMERHDYVEYQIGDKDEAVVFAGVYLDIFTWGSLVYSWEETVTTFTQTGEETDSIKKNIGFQGAIPLTWLAHPQITYSVGIQSDDDSSSDDKNGTWEPSHTLRATDELKLAKTITLSGYVEYANKVYDDDIGFTYFLLLEQLLGSRAKHSLSFEQEPRSTLGSTTETETTTYAYTFNIQDLFIYNLNLGSGASYEVATPLGDVDAKSEKTTMLYLNLAHTRQVTRQLSRIISYNYSWENSNFHDDGAMQEHLISYGFNYIF